MESTHGQGVIGVLYTGGTFGMVPTADGLGPSSDLPGRIEHTLAEMGERDLPEIEWLDHGWQPIASCDVRPGFWYDLAAAIERASERCRGFVVIHGTDTLAYTGSALSFLLADLRCPVVVTGAASPLGEADSDAVGNFLDALRAAANQDLTEVTIAFGHQLLRANRTTKRHGVDDNPFSSPCMPPLATLGATAEWHDVSPPPQPSPELPTRHPRQSHVRVGVLPVYPGISGDVVRAQAGATPDALVLEGYSAGIGPGDDQEFVAALHDVIATGTVVGAVSQGHHGRVTLGKYASSTPIANAGVVGGADITRESAVAKLHILLAGGLDPDSVRRLFARDLRGELTATE